MPDEEPLPRNWTRRLRLILLAGGLACASVLLALAIGEVLVRRFAPQQLILKRPDIWRPADSLGWVHRANVRTTINTGERTVTLVTDRDGFRIGRGGSVEAAKRVLLLGDSFMEALQVEYEESVPGLLERALRDRLGAPVAIRNTAVGGWDPPHYLLQARKAIDRERYDLVIIALYLGNDVVNWRGDRIPSRTPAEVHRLRFPRDLHAAEFVDAVLYPINDLLEVRSHLFILLKRRTEALLMRLGLTAAWFPVEFLRREATSTRWAVTGDICRDIGALSARRGVPTLVVLFPTSFQVDRAEFERYVQGFDIDVTAVDLEQPNRLLTEALRTRGLPVLDLLPALRAVQRGGTSLYGSVDRHLSPAGHAAAAAALAPVVAEYLSRPRGR